MDVIARVRNICLTPSTEWQVIADEAAPAATLVTRYVLPRAGLSGAAGFIGGSLVGYTLPLAAIGCVVCFRLRVAVARLERIGRLTCPGIAGPAEWPVASGSKGHEA